MGNASRLRDHICERFDPRDMTWCFLRRAEEAIASLGITLYLHNDFSRLVQVNRENRESWFPVMPMFDPQYYAGGQAFWIEGLNESGETVSAQAARCYYLFDDKLADSLMTLSLFYDDPSKSGKAEACNCRAPSAFRLASRICYSGGTWARRDFRGSGLARLLARISRILAFVEWDTDYVISLADPVLVEKGIVDSYGYRNIEPGIEWVNSVSQGNLKLVLLWMDRAEMLCDLRETMVLGDAVQLSPPRPREQPRNSSETRLARTIVNS